MEISIRLDEKNDLYNIFLLTVNCFQVAMETEKWKVYEV